MIGLVKSKVSAGVWPDAAGCTVATGLTAAANATATAALQLTAEVNVIGTSTATNNSVILPPVVGVGSTVVVRNADSGDTVNVYAAGGGTVNGVSTTHAIGAGKQALYVSIGTNAWVGLLSA